MNRKGYMLVEIILASVIAFGIAYFLINLTIKLKNKNDDMFVETLVETDRAIITNKIMENIFSEDDEFDCSKLNKDNNTIIYNNKEIDIVNEYTQVGNIECQKSDGYVSVKIPLSVIQMSDKNYDILINHNYQIGDSIPPHCKLGISNEKDKVDFIDTETGDDIGLINGLKSYTVIKGTDKPNYDDIKNWGISIDGVGIYTGYVKDEAGNEGTCKLEIVATNGSQTYTCMKDGYCTKGELGHGQGNAAICWEYGQVVTTDMGSVTNCRNECVGRCSGRMCNHCSGEFYYYNGQCLKDDGIPSCENGWTNVGGVCYKYNQSSCPTGSTGILDANLCPDGYAKINDEYCYKY